MRKTFPANLTANLGVGLWLLGRKERVEVEARGGVAGDLKQSNVSMPLSLPSWFSSSLLIPTTRPQHLTFPFHHTSARLGANGNGQTRRQAEAEAHDIGFRLLGRGSLVACVGADFGE